MVLFVRSWAAPRCTRHAVCAATAAVAAAFGTWACSSPTEFATTPEFLVLEPAFMTVSAATSGNRVPDDSCPRVLPPVAAGNRRTLSEIGATIELPSDTRELSHAFGKQSGAAFLSPTLGLIAFGYDSDLPALVSNIGLRQRSGRRDFGFFTRWCPLTINGVRATLYVEPYAFTQDSKSTILFGRDIVIITTAPSGRRVNIRISGSRAPFDSLRRAPNGLSLVAAASGIQW